MKVAYKIRRHSKDIYEVTDISDDYISNTMSSYIIDKNKILDKAILKCFSLTQLQSLRNNIELAIKERLNEA